LAAGGSPQNTHLSATINISGLGIFNITTASHTWLAQNNSGGLGRNLSVNWITLNEPGLISVSYGLATNLGPILESAPENVIQFTGVSTEGGLLAFTSISSVTFTAVTGTPVPEPGTLSAAAIGVAGLLILRRKAVGGR